MRGHDRVRSRDKIQTSIDDQRADGDGSGHCERDSSRSGQHQETIAMEVRMDSSSQISQNHSARSIALWFQIAALMNRFKQPIPTQIM